MEINERVKKIIIVLNEHKRFEYKDVNICINNNVTWIYNKNNLSHVIFNFESVCYFTFISE